MGGLKYQCVLYVQYMKRYVCGLEGHWGRQWGLLVRGNSTMQLHSERRCNTASAVHHDYK